jgi:hypothetical protein
VKKVIDLGSTKGGQFVYWLRKEKALRELLYVVVLNFGLKINR